MKRKKSKATEQSEPTLATSADFSPPLSCTVCVAPSSRASFSRSLHRTKPTSSDGEQCGSHEGTQGKNQPTKCSCNARRRGSGSLKTGLHKGGPQLSQRVRRGKPHRTNNESADAYAYSTNHSNKSGKGHARVDVDGDDRGAAHDAPRHHRRQTLDSLRPSISQSQTKHHPAAVAVGSVTQHHSRTYNNTRCGGSVRE